MAGLYAATYPERVHALALFHPAHDFPEDTTNYHEELAKLRAANEELKAQLAELDTLCTLQQADLARKLGAIVIGHTPAQAVIEDAAAWSGGVLQPSDGLGMYRSLGFEPFAHFAAWSRRALPHDS